MQKLLSLIIVIGYFALLGAIIYIEASDNLNMAQGQNSFMDIIKILIGVLTAVVTKIVYYWFDPNSSKASMTEGSDIKDESSKTT